MIKQATQDGCYVHVETTKEPGEYVRLGELFNYCMKCADRDFCNSCLVRNFNENNGDMFKVSKHFCKVAHLNHKCFEEYYQKKNV